MEIYTVSFFGHRVIACGTEADSRLDRLLQDIITQKEYAEKLGKTVVNIADESHLTKR